MQFPMDFPVKVMGLATDGFADEIVAVVLAHAPDFDPATTEMRPSRTGRYLSLTTTIRATSRAQLDELYRALTAHPMVKIAL
ncbi:MAG: YbeD family protein [Lautropia sp.]